MSWDINALVAPFFFFTSKCKLEACIFHLTLLSSNYTTFIWPAWPLKVFKFRIPINLPSPNSFNKKVLLSYTQTLSQCVCLPNRLLAAYHFYTWLYSEQMLSKYVLRGGREGKQDWRKGGRFIWLSQWILSMYFFFLSARLLSM